VKIPAGGWGDIQVSPMDTEVRVETLVRKPRTPLEPAFPYTVVMDIHARGNQAPPRATAPGISARGFPATVDGLTRHRDRLEVRAEWPADRPCSRTGPIILTESRRHTASATATRPVPWTGVGQSVLDTGFPSPIVTPGSREFRSPPALPVLHLDDVNRGLRAFVTPATDRHTLAPPPGFAVALTPRQRMARTRQYEEYTDPNTELAIAQADVSWGNVARQDSSTGDGTGSVNGESQGPADKSYLPFASKISLVL